MHNLCTEVTSSAWRNCQLQAQPMVGSVAEQFGAVVQKLCWVSDWHLLLPLVNSSKRNYTKYNLSKHIRHRLEAGMKRRKP